MKIKNVVYIEDDASDILIFERALLKVDPNIELLVINNLEEHDLDHLLPNETIIFVDLKLEFSYGVDVFNHYLKGRAFPVYILTSSDNPSDAAKSNVSGVDGYFEKPLALSGWAHFIKTAIEFTKLNIISGMHQYTYDVNDLIEEKKTLTDRITFLENKLVEFRGSRFYPEDNAYMPKVDLDELYIKIAKNISAGVYVFDVKDGKNTYINKEYEMILGYTLKEIRKMSSNSFEDMFLKDELPRIQEHMQKVISCRENEVQKLIYHFRHKDGSFKKLFGLDRPFQRDKEGQVTSFMGVFFELPTNF